jgi:predicted ABC-type exoprotein transport system permease subunit
MMQDRWYERPPPQFITAVLIATLVFVLVNPLMANERVFGQDPWHTFALLLPVMAALAFLHFSVPRHQRASIARYCLRVVGVSLLAYAAAAIVLVVAVVAITGEFI